MFQRLKDMMCMAKDGTLTCFLKSKKGEHKLALTVLLICHFIANLFAEIRR